MHSYCSPGGLERVNELVFVEMTSLSRRYSRCKGVIPIFALPAVHSIMLEPLFHKLYYPVFSATVTAAYSIKQAAHKLYQVCLFCFAVKIASPVK
jgi:hypothetical protein